MSRSSLRPTRPFPLQRLRSQRKKKTNFRSLLLFQVRKSTEKPLSLLKVIIRKEVPIANLLELWKRLPNFHTWRSNWWNEERVNNLTFWRALVSFLSLDLEKSGVQKPSKRRVCREFWVKFKKRTITREEHIVKCRRMR